LVALQIRTGLTVSLLVRRYIAEQCARQRQLFRISIQISQLKPQSIHSASTNFLRPDNHRRYWESLRKMAAATDASPAAVELRPLPTKEHVSTASERPEYFKSTLQECLFVLTATMSIAMPSFLDGICIIISTVVAHDLQMTSAQITWISASSS
jgi:hypothetical protein